MILFKDLIFLRSHIDVIYLVTWGSIKGKDVDNNIHFDIRMSIPVSKTKSACQPCLIEHVLMYNF